MAASAHVKGLSVRLAVVLIAATIAAGCASDSADPRVHTSSEVSAAFSRGDLPVDTFLFGVEGEVPCEDFPGVPGVETDDEVCYHHVYRTGDGPVPDAVLSPRRPQPFSVLLYATASDAEAVADGASTVDPVRNMKREFVREANVVVVVQPPDDALRARVETILDDL